MMWWTQAFVVVCWFVGLGAGNPDAKRLYDDLMSSYNRLIRPVSNNSDTLTVKMGLKLSQLIDVNLKNQIMTTNVWVNQEWSDHKLKWDPDEYGGVTHLYVPAEQIWLPDIVLYNNADGNYEVTIMTKAIIHNDGKVVWNPPAIYKSSCQIDVQYFPFDKQDCFMKFGSWTYDGYQVDLKHLEEIPDNDTVPIGMDLSEFYLSVEWDIMAVPAHRRVRHYSCCVEPYPDITFNITLRRKTLFYTVNLIIPCVGISGLSVLVFYLPSDSGEKVSLSVSILLSLTFFFLVLSEIIPSTSLAMPLLGKYLVFTMILVTVSVIVTIAVLNVHFRSPSTHRMAPWVRRIFIRLLPRILLMRPPQYKIETDDNKGTAPAPSLAEGYMKEQVVNSTGRRLSEELVIHDLESSPGIVEKRLPRQIERAIHNAMFIAQHIDNKDDFESIKEDWKYVAMVIDRLFLYVFTFACIAGTCGIFLQAPSLYDPNKPIDIALSKVALGQDIPDVLFE
ncbi:acetylcholine receptor subunit alpha-like 1 [Parasteatoda tepidariorum]|uniref:acetylcholine receptor subunit alpha-like 1 n=1 Tax=Parasteatoda tepidariorum TaxID=114398 RepID=UPI00077FC897|nr:acetylcholine receptor subunit alpha-like 1 [Parasteatoda tepidariorum]